MKTLNDYLNMAKEKTDKDEVTAKILGVTPAAISKARKRGTLSPENVVTLAQLINVNPAEIHMACDVARKPENKAIWAKWATSALFILGLFVVDINLGNQAVAAEVSTDSIYIMRYLLAFLALRWVWSWDTKNRGLA